MMNQIRSLITIIAITFGFLIAGLPFHALAQSNLYMIDGNPIFHQVDVQTGDQTSLGNPGGLVRPIGLADFQERLFTLDRLLSIKEIDVSSGAVIQETQISGTTVFSEGAMAIDSDGTIFYSGTTFDRISLETGDATTILSQNIAIDGMDFRSDGALFGIEKGNPSGTVPNLYTINTATGEKTLVGSTGLTSDILHWQAAGLSFDENDNLYWAVGRNLYTLDTQTGAATLATNLNWGGAQSASYGLSFVNSYTAVPEPSGLVTFVLVSFIFTRGRRR